MPEPTSPDSGGGRATGRSALGPAWDPKTQGGSRGRGRTREAGARGRRDVTEGESRAAPARRARASYEPVHLSDDVVRELQATARPGKAEILVQVFSEAAAAYAAGDDAESARLGDQAKHIALRAGVIRELLGIALYRLGRYKEAAGELSAFRRMSGTTEQNPVLADCYRALGRPERAVELCDEIDARAVSPAVFYEGAIVAAGALHDMGKTDDGIRRLEALELNPATASEHHLRAWYVLADLLEHRGRFTQARRWFEAVAAVDPEATDAPARLSEMETGLHGA